MIPMLLELFEHQSWADASLLDAVRSHDSAWNDEKLRWTLHHILMVQRGFLALCTGSPFDIQKEMQIPESLAALEQTYRESHEAEWAFVSRLQPEDLTRNIDMPWIPGCHATLAQCLMQVVMHSQNHRGQCLTRLRALGAKTPTLDFIIWVKDRPAGAATA